MTPGTPSPTAFLRALLVARCRQAARMPPAPDVMEPSEAKARLSAAVLQDLALRGRLRRKIPILWEEFKAQGDRPELGFVLPDKPLWTLEDLLK